MRAESRELDKIYKRRDRYEIPDWQRKEVWPSQKKQLLIDTILRDWRLPKFYFLKVSSDPDEYEVVDGQQRLMAIFEFLDNELPLSDQSAKVFRAAYYEKLPEAISYPHRERLGAGFVGVGGSAGAPALEAPLQQAHQAGVPIADDKQNQERRGEVVMVGEGVEDRREEIEIGRASCRERV